MGWIRTAKSRKGERSWTRMKNENTEKEKGHRANMSKSEKDGQSWTRMDMDGHKWQNT